MKPPWTWWEAMWQWGDNGSDVEWCEHRHRTKARALDCARFFDQSWEKKWGERPIRYYVVHHIARLVEDRT